MHPWSAHRAKLGSRLLAKLCRGDYLKSPDFVRLTAHPHGTERRDFPNSALRNPCDILVRIVLCTVSYLVKALTLANKILHSHSPIMILRRKEVL